jgi:hypothetical protein
MAKDTYVVHSLLAPGWYVADHRGATAVQDINKAHRFTKQRATVIADRAFKHEIKSVNEEANIHEAAEFGHPDQKSMHKVLKTHGWVPAKKTDYKENFSLKGEHSSTKLKKYEGKRTPQSVIDHIKQTRHYVHPDRPHQSIQTVPGGSEYNVWTHYRGTGPSKEHNGMQYLGGKRGNSGKAAALDSHLKSRGMNEEAGSSYKEELPHILKDIRGKKKSQSDLRREYGSNWKRLANATSAEHGSNYNRAHLLQVGKQHMNEEAPANSVGGGKIAGMGVGPQGEPGVGPKAMKRYKDKNATEAPKAGRKTLSMFMQGK